MKLTGSTQMYQRLCCEATMPLVDRVPEKMKTATIDRPIAISYEITCAAERSAPSSGYVEPLDQPDRMMPYTPIAEQASTTSTPTLRSVSCSAVSLPAMETVGPNGTTENARNAGTAETIGARMKIGLSASAGMMSSFS